MKVKILLVCLLIVAFVGGSRAQIAKHVSEDAKSSEKTIQNAPFSADSVTESVQILWDGTKIVRKMSSKLYRDNEGRFRREDSKMQLGVPGQNVEIAESIRIIDPVGGVRYVLDIKDRKYKRSDTRKTLELKIDSKFKIGKENEWNLKKEAAAEKHAEQQTDRYEQQTKRNEQQTKRNEQQAKRNEKQAKQKEEEAERQVKEVEQGIKPVEISVKQIENAVEGDGKRVPVYNPGDNKPPEKLSPNDDKKDPKSKTEALGTQTIEGVTVEGTRTTTTIPMGAIGNDRDINIVYEKWYSKELQMTVFSKHSDPRFGEQIYRLSNISRTNPARSLFTPPADYRDDDDDDDDDDGDDDGRTKKPRIPAKPSAPRVTVKPLAPPIGKPPAMPKKPVV